MNVDQNFCTNCGVAVAQDSKYCQRCGEPLSTTEMLSPPMFSPSSEPDIHSYAGADHPDQPLAAPTYQPQHYDGAPAMVGRKNPGIAAVLSFLVIGLGQIYNGQILKGLLMLGVAILCGITIVGLIVSFIIWLYGVFDAYGTAKRMNQDRGYPE
ncbi:MAG: zinc-ribbon domain-containing protein [Halobacteriota archaeon]